jgi:hypothetical protein
VSVGNGAAGGLVGNGTNVSMSYATGSVTGSDGAAVGGLAGVAEHVDQSYATGAVIGGSSGAWAGGFVGTGSIITNSYSTGPVRVGSLKSDVGGFAGVGQGIKASYSLGQVNAAGGSAVGGFVGKSVGRGNQEDYWDTETSGQVQGCGRGGNCSGLTGLTTAELKSGLPAGFDSKVWGQDLNTNGGFPYLLTLPPN